MARWRRPSSLLRLTALACGAYRLTNRHSGKALDNANIGTDGNPVIPWTVDIGSPQQWNMTEIG
ncbi:RICIN domain-containing protein [Kitasatospora sp. NPDC091207]|uniref:RICIN domain-containing protein n=1 Tax=Kitasatospora sp. NPDC091207 TaxID=3364083 RepID=UPI0037F9127B